MGPIVEEESPMKKTEIELKSNKATPKKEESIDEIPSSLDGESDEFTDEEFEFNS